MSTQTRLTEAGAIDVPLLARVLANGRDQLSVTVARHILNAGFSKADQVRMHELAVKNQNDELSQAEKQELHAFGRVGDVLAILKSKARRKLRTKPSRRLPA